MEERNWAGGHHGRTPQVLYLSCLPHDPQPARLCVHLRSQHILAQLDRLQLKLRLCLLFPGEKLRQCVGPQGPVLTLSCTILRGAQGYIPPPM